MNNHIRFSPRASLAKTGNDNPDTFIIVGNTTITATLSKEEYRIYIPLVSNNPPVGAADLVVDELLASNSNIEANDPDQPPSPVNEIWSFLESHEFVSGSYNYVSSPAVQSLSALAVIPMLDSAQQRRRSELPAGESMTGLGED